MNHHEFFPNFTRRQVLAAGGASTLAASMSRPGIASDIIRGKAEHVISIWLGGGMGAGDTFDPKMKGDPAKKQAGSYYDSIETAVAGVRVCEHLKQVAGLMDCVTAVRTVNHNVIDEHAYWPSSQWDRRLPFAGFFSGS